MSIYDDSAADDVPVWEPQSQPITLSEIAAEVGLSRDDIHQWMRVYSDFPKPLGLSGHDKTFDRAEVSAWLHKNRLHQYECANHNDWQTVRDMAEVIGMAPHRLATHLRRVPGRYPDGLNSDSPAVTTLNSCSTKLQSSDLTKPQADSCDDIYCRVHGYASEAKIPTVCRGTQWCVVRRHSHTASVTISATIEKMSMPKQLIQNSVPMNRAFK